PRDLPVEHMRRMSHDPRDERSGGARSGPHASGDAGDVSGGNAPADGREPQPLDHRSAEPEAWGDDAADRAVARGRARDRRLSVEPGGLRVAVLAEREELERGSTDEAALGSWTTTSDHKRIGMRYLHSARVVLMLRGLEAL